MWIFITVHNTILRMRECYVLELLSQIINVTSQKSFTSAVFAIRKSNNMDFEEKFALTRKPTSQRAGNFPIFQTVPKI